MKAKLLLLPITLLACSLLTGCEVKDNTKYHITYGTYCDTTVKDLSYGDMMGKLVGGNEETENYLLAMYYGKDSHCSCWGTFKTVLNEYVTKYNTVVYSVDRFEFDSQRKESDGDTWKKAGLSFMDKDEPRFFIMQQGKVKKAFYYKTDSKMFKNCDALNSEISNHILAPNMYYIEQDELDNRIFAEKLETAVHYVWSFCPDCQYCAPHVLMPYFNTHATRNKLYIIDIGELTGYDPTAKNPFENFSKTNPEYVAFLKDHHMSAAGDEVFGYDRGFVPTTQVWKNGQLTDMSVYFNDTIEQAGEAWVIKDSYYTSERLPNLKYAANVSVKVLKGANIADSVVTGGSWNQDNAAVYHNAFLNAFLDMYVK